MNQAARCPNCRTAFRVQPQLLQASGGWARCGQCGEVFNALQSLVTVAPAGPASTQPQSARSAAAGVPSPGPWAGPAFAGRAAGASAAQDSRLPPVSSLYRRAEPGPSPTAPPRPAPPAKAPAPAFVPPAAPAIRPPATPVADNRASMALPREAAQAPAVPPTPVPTPAPSADAEPAWLNSRFPASRFEGMDVPDAPATPASSPALPQAESSLAMARAATPPPVAAAGVGGEAPSFLQAPPPAREPTGEQRTWWSAAAAVLMLMALLQAALIARPTLSARYPDMRPLLHPLCVLTRCNAEAAPRHLAALAVESSALSRLSGNDRRYRLSLVLRNRDTQALRWPAIELRLTDAQGVLLVRKVLRVRDMGASVAALPPGQEQPLQAVLDMGEQPVAGYSVELFYP